MQRLSVNKTMLGTVKLIKLVCSKGFSPIFRAEALTTNV
jgi:hypothetical protein